MGAAKDSGLDWVSTIKNMPEIGQQVIAVDVCGDMGVAEFKNGVFYAIAFGFDAYENNGCWASGPDRIIGHIKYWMPLPETPTT